MKNFLSILLKCTGTLVILNLLTGCHTHVQAPGAIGTVVDADTSTPIPRASITRPFISSGTNNYGVPPEGIPAATVAADKYGRFNLPPSTHTEIMFMYMHNYGVSGTFLVFAPGYVTNQLQGTADSNSRWRVNLGKVALKKSSQQ